MCTFRRLLLSITSRHIETRGEGPGRKLRCRQRRLNMLRMLIYAFTDTSDANFWHGDTSFNFDAWRHDLANTLGFMRARTSTSLLLSQRRYLRPLRADF